MNRYKRVREMAGFTQKELAQLVGLKPAAISRYEDEGSNNVIPPLVRIEQIAKVCSVPISFLTDPKPLLPLNDEQSKRFRQSIKSYNDALKRWPEESVATYGTNHPFLYMLKDRWLPTLEDVQYISRKFGIDAFLILHTEMPSNSDINSALGAYAQRSDQPRKISFFDNPKKIIETINQKGLKKYPVSIDEATRLIMSGVVVLSDDTGEDLYLRLDDLDFDTINALTVLSQKNKQTRKEQERMEWIEMLSEREPSQDPADHEKET